MIPIVPVAGTWGRRGTSVRWFHPKSPLHTYLCAAGFDYLRGEDGTMFEWTTDVQGFQFWRRLFGMKPSRGDWEVGGINLEAFLSPPLAPSAAWPSDRVHVIAHSHGLQVALEAAARGQYMNTLISVCSPVREDYMDVARAALPKIGKWIHLYSDDADNMQIAGELGDGDIGCPRKHPLADHNFFVPEGHSNVLNDPRLFVYLVPALRLLRARHGNGFKGRPR